MAQVLLLLFIVLAIITVVGHAIWVLLAWLSRIISGGDGQRPPERRRTDLAKERCPYCEWPMVPGQLRCGRCWRPRQGAVPAELSDLEATQRQLIQLVEAGSLDLETYKRLEIALHARRALLVERVTSPAPMPKEPEKVPQPLVASAAPLAPAAESGPAP